MKRVFCLVVLIQCQVGAWELSPWLGNWFEFEAGLSQSHTQSKKVDTTHGAKSHQLHSEKTTASLAFVPLVDLSGEVELDFAKTQKRGYGFEAVKAGVRYSLLNDLMGDPVSLTTGCGLSFSTPKRVRDLSSTEHAVFEGDLFVACGKEFGYRDKGFYRAWLMGLVGAGSSGAPWVGGELHFEKVFDPRHAFDLFLKAERGLATRKLHHVKEFHSFSRLGYEFEEVGVKYTLVEVGYGSLYLQGTRRVHARYCPRDTWSIKLGVVIPFSPW